MAVCGAIARDDSREAKVRQIDGTVPVEVLTEARGSTAGGLHTAACCCTLGG
jgi:hypothetical protein